MYTFFNFSIKNHLKNLKKYRIIYKNLLILKKMYTFLKNKYKTLYTKNIIITLGKKKFLTNTLKLLKLNFNQKI